MSAIESLKRELEGIRIEDNYWIVPGGAVCLSDEIPKSLEEVQNLVKQEFLR